MTPTCAACRKDFDESIDSGGILFGQQIRFFSSDISWLVPKKHLCPPCLAAVNIFIRDFHKNFKTEPKKLNWFQRLFQPKVPTKLVPSEA